MNQLFNNEGYLTPEKRCSKGPFQYKYRNPKEYKVTPQSYVDGKVVSVLFPQDSPSAYEILEPRPKSSYQNFEVYSYQKWQSQDYQRLTGSIDSAKKFLTESRAYSRSLHQNNIMKTQKETSFAIQSVQRNIGAINELAEELELLKNEINHRMSISELDN